MNLTKVEPKPSRPTYNLALSERELTILAALAGGLSNNVAMDALKVKPDRVKAGRLEVDALLTSLYKFWPNNLEEEE